ncbi:MAG: zf-HC2 domain-containing protein [Deltaproteobacteria bacterium]|nr:zf-HC2 domain-containing protein [Deltaproteobacteria bacterium]
MTHLTPERLEALLDGSLPARERRALGAHLAGECQQCAEVLAEGPDLDTLARLLEAEAADPEPLDVAAGWAALEAALPDTKAGEAISHPRRRWRGGLGVALALAAAAALFVLFSGPEPSPEVGVKGVVATVAPEVHLRVVAGRAGAERFDLDRRVVSGDRVDRGETLLFEVETDRRAARYLFAVDPGVTMGGVTFLAPPDGETTGLEPAGRHRVTWGGEWVALDLDDAPASLTVVCAASTAPLDPLDVVSGWLEGRPPPGVGYEAITVEVSP